MDDEATELAELRRRAYGPDADIAADPAALERLIELEHGVRAASTGPAAGATDIDTTTAAGTTAAGAGPVRPGPAAPLPRGRRWHLALIAGVGAVAVVLATAAGFSPDPVPASDVVAPIAIDAFLTDPSSRVLLQIPINSTAGDAADVSAAGDPPIFSVPETMQWTSPLGRYYGWQLWLARSQSGLPCIALVRDPAVAARCALSAEFDRGALVVDVSFFDIPGAERPAGMTGDQSIAFRWLPGEFVYAVIGRAPPLTAPTTLAP